MHSLEADGDTNVLYLRFAGDVTRGDLTDLGEDAVRTARSLDASFALVTDLGECVGFPPASTGQVRETLRHFVSFGLAAECRVIGTGTPRRAVEAFATAAAEFDYPVAEFPTRAAARRAALDREH